MRCDLAMAGAVAAVLALAGCGSEYQVGPSGSGGSASKEAGASKTGSAAPARARADDKRLFDNLKRIAVAMHSHHDTHKKFPPAAIRGDGGEALLSWRVALLPFLGQQALYDQFHLNEPWDSPHNKSLVERMPEVYRTDAAGAGKTSVMVFVGPQAPFGIEEGPSVRDIRDGTSNTILCVVAGADKAVPWTKPEDLPFNVANPLSAMGQLPGDYFICASFDGFVRSIRTNIDPQLLAGLITHSGGEVFVW
jgi:hypothetical protein